MPEDKQKNIKEVIFKKIKENFLDIDENFWQKIEPDIAIFCSDFINPTTPDKTKQFIKQLKQIKNFLLGNNITKEKLKFLSEEIKKYSETKTISLYQEEDDTISPEDIEYYSRYGEATEGVVGIHLPLNYAQLGKLTNGVFGKTDLIKFYISKEKVIYGKIIAEIYEQAQEIPVATLVESRKRYKGTEEAEYKEILLFGAKKLNSSQHIRIKEIHLPFYVYRFITEDNQEMILLSPDSCEIGDYIITGVMTKCDDYKMLTDSAKLPTKLPFFFVHTVKNRIIKFKNNEEFKQKLDKINIPKEIMQDYPFTCKNKHGKHFRLIHPEWFKLLIWSWMVHEEKGMHNSYPMHLMMIAKPGTGKSWLLNGLFEKSKENRRISSGAGSTLKALVPSFKYSPAKLGYLAESNRFSFCDEFLRCLVKTTSNNNHNINARADSLAIMNDLLEHQKREVSSGVSRINVNMTSRILAVTNPTQGASTFDEMLKIHDMSFISRWVIYFQTKEHIKMIEKSEETELKEYENVMDNNDFIAIIDYLQSFSAKFDQKRTINVYKDVSCLFSERMQQHYNNVRQKHHILCIMDGIIKTRCLFEKDMSFTANEKDYESLQLLWNTIVGSWIDFAEVKYINIKERIFYMPEKSQQIYKKVIDAEKAVCRIEIQESLSSKMTRKEFLEALIILTENGLIQQEGDGKIRPYFMEKTTPKYQWRS